MAIPLIVTRRHAEQNGWTLNGSVGNMYAEKNIKGGRIVACSTTEEQLLMNIQEQEVHMGRQKSSPLL
jgi:hypothetical protein